MISVVVPVYNVLPYLASCVESLLAQTYAALEIILVDDGSTDGSGALCDRCAERDGRVKVLHRANGGLSDARNAGVRAASGEWIYFADSDDWLEPDAIETLHAFAVANRCEVVQGNFYYAFADRLLYRKADCRERRKTVLSRSEAMHALIRNDRVKSFAWGKLYKASVVKDLEFPVGRFFEDSFWQHLAVHRTARYGVVDRPLYYYRQRRDSISGTRSDNLRDLADGCQCRLEFIEKHYPQYGRLMQKVCDKTRAQVFGTAGAPHRPGRLWTKAVERLRAITRYKTLRLR